MIYHLHYNTISPLLQKTLKELMQAKEFEPFRLVGGTSLSLQRGHRVSVDIDLFTDAPYNSIDFNLIDSFLKKKYAYVSTSNFNLVGMGRPYYIGKNAESCIKLDLFYTDPFIRDARVINKIRLATIEEIIAMKMDIISRGGRKKDFWDLHELIEDFSLEQMLALHKERYPYTHDAELLKKQLVQFQSADDDFEPLCLRKKHWELIKLDLIDFVQG
jgi:predicted nucleotidyltransferase component of viral defense system